VLRILSHVGRLESVELPPGLAERVEIVPIPMDGDLDPGLTGEVLLSTPTAVPNLADALSRGVRWVHLIGTGIDRFPVEMVGADRVLTNSRGLSAVPISEWVLACMLAFEKRLPDAWITEVPERWNIPDTPLGTLHGKTLALLGLGGIGAAVAERALPFAMTVKAMRRSDTPSPVPGVEMVATPEELVADADHVVLVAPLTAATRGLVDRRLFEAMEPGVHLVNVARGPLVVQDDLRLALDDGTVARASLDTTDPEPLPAGHWLYTHPKVRLSPHTSWNFPGAFSAMYEVFAENLGRYLDGRPLLSVVDPADGY
jgi:phosphoglycerate dehydrogenase-like enzyme